MKINEPWSYKRATLVWLSPTVGLVRVHDTDQIPGPWDYAMNIVVEGDRYEIIGARGPFPENDEVREFYRHMKSLGLKKGYKRARAGKAMYSVGDAYAV